MLRFTLSVPIALFGDERVLVILEWFGDRAKVCHRGRSKYDSQINQPTAEFPTAVMRPDFSGYGGQIMTLDGISWETIQLN